jgi:hypothetical protein
LNLHIDKWENPFDEAIMRNTTHDVEDIIANGLSDNWELVFSHAQYFNNNEFFT